MPDRLTAPLPPKSVSVTPVISDKFLYGFCSFLEMNMISRSYVSNWTAHACDYYEVTVDLDINK